MMISRGRRYIFVHIPKTGGTAMALALEARAKADDILIGDTPKAQRRKHRLKHLKTSGRLWKHAMLSDLDGVISPDEMAEMFCFTLVRNPWDRLVSYYHWLRAQSFAHPAVDLSRSLSFADFLHHPVIEAPLRAAPAARYVTDRTGVLRADAFVRLEHLREDLAPLEQHLGFEIDMPRANPSERLRDYRRYYDDVLASHVADICSADIARFSYSFDTGF